MNNLISIDNFFKTFNSKNVSLENFTYPKTPDIGCIRKIAKQLFIEKIKPFYNQQDILVNTAVFNFLLEPLKNGNFYSFNNEPLEVELMLSSKLLGISYFDGGVYFTREDVKQCWESRVFHPNKTYSSEKQIGFGLGTKFIYEMADFIFVDTIFNKLYTGLLTDKRFFAKREDII